MPEQAEHCPFLNRTDPRCAGHFQLDHLQHAYKFCFDQYEACPVYLELLIERRARRALPADKESSRGHGSPVIQVTITRRYPAESSTRSPVPAALGR